MELSQKFEKLALENEMDIDSLNPNGTYASIETEQAWLWFQDGVALRQQLAEQPNVDVLVEALKHADEFIRNGVEFGYIKMPDDDLKGIDSAHDTPKIIAKALAAYQSKNEKGL